jgi:hypothetical protein
MKRLGAAVGCNEAGLMTGSDVSETYYVSDVFGFNGDTFVFVVI